MKPSAQLLLPLAGVSVLVVAVLAAVFWPAASAPPAPQVPSSVPSPVAKVEPESRGPASAPRQPAPPAAAAVSTPAPGTPAQATVVPVGPGDEVPSPEVADPRPQVNDPLAPEKPQTAQWKLGKTQRITSLLERDVGRLEHDRQAARAHGDEAERQRLDTLIQRHQGRLKKLREEIQQLSRQAENEPPEQ